MKTKNAILYIRVSTDEQAEKGHSLPSQKEKLEKYCERNGLKVLKIFSEDYTAWKGFDRPVYNELKKYILDNKKNIDYLLVTQWSRFSRDIEASMTELKHLKKLGIEANAIEQWVDSKVPENLYMRAFYLAAPQVENDRLSLRVKDAIRKARKEGKWMSKAPYGYFNDKNAKVCLPHPLTKDLVAYSFKTFATGAYTIAEVRELAKAKGLSLKKQQFINMLSNPFYIGKIFIEAYEDEPEYYQNGIHLPIVNEDDFYAVQRILNGKRKPYQGKTKGEELPLKGHLLCPKCRKIMTGSASKGNGGYYHYYHCQRKYGCKNAYSALEVNRSFERYLEQFKFNEEVLELYYHILHDTFKTNDVEREKEKQQLEKEITHTEIKIKNLDDMLATGTLPIERYNRLVSALEEQQNELIIKHATLTKSATEFRNHINYSVHY